MSVYESYTLADFYRDGWMNRPEYNQYQGIALAHLKRLHEGHELVVEDDVVAFVEVRGSAFLLHLYVVESTDPQGVVSTANPCFRVFGRTWEGITEVQACVAFTAMPDEIIAQMRWAQDFVAQRGWTDD